VTFGTVAVGLARISLRHAFFFTIQRSSRRLNSLLRCLVSAQKDNISHPIANTS
jgi:hypothetical protein